jgi:hypothetical protein
VAAAVARHQGPQLFGILERDGGAKVQESADGATGWTDIAGAAFAQVTSASDDSIYVGTIRMEGPRLRYLRAVAVVATAACLAAVQIHLGRPVSLPAQTPAFNV